jgi:hypothetical protein
VYPHPVGVRRSRLIANHGKRAAVNTGLTTVMLTKTPMMM